MTVFIVAISILLVLTPAPAGADAPGPTNFESKILSVDPATPGVTASMLGGDSFFSLEVASGLEVIVIGYRGEPYLRFNADGTVEENRLSPSKYLNEERFGDTDIPEFADADAVPDWILVASAGKWVWHDHRTHLMSRQTLPGIRQGDQVNAGVIPIFVDGQEVDVSVGTFWLGRSSFVGVILGATIGLVAAAVALIGSRQWRRIICASALLAALVIGTWQYWSLPAATGPSTLHWLFPTLGLIAIGASALSGHRATLTTSTAFLALGAANLLAWGAYRRSGLLAAILPTNAPELADRAVTSMAIVIGLSLSALILRSLLDPEEQINRA